MNTMPTHLMAQPQIHERLAEAERERLIRVARSASPRPVGFTGATGTFAANLVQPLKSAIAAVVHAVHQPNAGLGKTPTNA